MPRVPIRSTPQVSVPQPPAIPRIDTERFYLRLLQVSDASQRWIGWMADPEVMKPLNSQISDVTMTRLQGTISRYDQVNKPMIGIFDREKELHIGAYMIKLDAKNRLANFNVMIGDKSYWGQRVVLETRAALLDYFFKRRNLAKATGTPFARNFPSVFNYRAQGWRLEGILKEHSELRHTPGRLDQLMFAMLKDEWIERRTKKQG